jgi:peptidoglycan/xylan/chitin deacetylase (PgdA/CDA1 family)
MDRRQLLTLLALGTVTACARTVTTTSAAATDPAPGPLPGLAPGPTRSRPPAPTPSPSPSEPAPTTTYTEEPALPEATSGPALLISQLPEQARLADYVALTVDDGFSSETVSAYVQFATDTGTHLTFNPNGVYGPIWERHADALRPLIEAGPVQIGNHTFSHKDVKRLSEHGIEEELQKNEDWVQTTFGTSTRPWFRPPFGFRDDRTDAVAAGLGWTNVLLWNGSFGDAAVLSPTVLMQQARKWLHSGTIMLGHANHPTVTHLYPQIVELLTERGLQPVTLREAFDTRLSPATPAATGTPGLPGSRAG